MIKDWFKRFLQKQQEKLDNSVDSTPQEIYDTLLGKLKNKVEL